MRASRTDYRELEKNEWSITKFVESYNHKRDGERMSCLEKTHLHRIPLLKHVKCHPKFVKMIQFSRFRDEFLLL